MEENLVLQFSKNYKKKNINSILSCILYFFIILSLSFRHIVEGKGKWFIILGGILLIFNLVEIISSIIELYNIRKFAYIKANHEKVEVCNKKIAKYDFINISDIKSYSFEGDIRIKNIIVKGKNNDLNINLRKIDTKDVDKLKKFFKGLGICEKGAVM